MRVAITGGGTGGHLFPGIAVGEEILRRDAGNRVLFIGTTRHVDSHTLTGRSFQVTSIKSRGLKGQGVIGLLLGALQVPMSIFQALGKLRRFQPDLVFGVGGYVTGPVILAAKLLGVPACIHEQNSVPGMANRKLGRLVNRVFLSLPGSEQYFPKEKCHLCGNPVRQEILQEADRRSKQQKKTSHEYTVFVLGGSQGAHALNLMCPEALETAQKRLGADIRVIHQTGSADETLVREAYEKRGMNATVSAFIDDMVAVYSKADLVVCRAGATTLAELTVLQLPAILIPYPYAADDHQKKNAQYLVEAGAAVMMLENECEPSTLGREIVNLLGNDKKRASMAEKAGQIAKPRATEDIIRHLLELIGTKSNVNTVNAAG